MAFSTTLEIHANSLAPLVLSLFIHDSIVWFMTICLSENAMDYPQVLLFDAWSCFGLCSGTVNKAFLQVDDKTAAKSSLLH